jgi:hypothetical protein
MITADVIFDALFIGRTRTLVIDASFIRHYNDSSQIP